MNIDRKDEYDKQGDLGGDTRNEVPGEGFSSSNSKRNMPERGETVHPTSEEASQLSAATGSGRRKKPMPDGVAPPPRHRPHSVLELESRFIRSDSEQSFAEILEHSSVMCTWQCDEGHQYRETRASHRHSRGCPVCATSVATRMPGLVEYWNNELNAAAATDVSVYSRERHHWRCEHGHDFERPPYRVLATGHQCQECRREGITPWRIAGKSDDGLTLAEAFPQIAAEWDRDLNSRGPEEFAPGSQRLAYWLCENGHSWSSPICHRTSAARHPASCQQCKAIAYVAPELARELHPSLNPADTALRVRKGSNDVLFWQCERGHVFTASVAARLRSTYPAACDKCRSIAVKAPDLINACWAYDLNGDYDPQELKTSSSDEVWWVRLDSLHIAPSERRGENYERKRIGYRYRRYLNNPEREILRLREFLASKSPSGTSPEAGETERSNDQSSSG